MFRRSFRILLKLAVAFVLVSPPAAAEKITAIEKPAGLRRLVLDNGLVALVQPARKAKTVSVYLAVRAGSADETVRPGSGLSHLAEHMIFKGTARRRAGEIEREVRRMGGETNAYTSYDTTVFYVNVLADHLEGALDLLSDVAFHSEFPPAEFEKEREVILSEFRLNEDRISQKAELALWRLIFQNHPYGTPVIGHRVLFEALKRADLEAFYRQHYVPNAMVLAIVGDVDPAAAEEGVRRYFGAAPRGPDSRLVRAAEARQMSPRKQAIRKESEHARLIIGFPGVAFSDSEAPALDVLAGVLGDGESSRLVQRLKENDESVLGVRAFSAALKDPGVFAVSALVLPEKLGAARAGILRELADARERPVSDREIEKIKNQVIAQFYKARETHGALCHDLLTNEVFTGDPRYSEIYPELIARVTPRDLLRAAARILREEALNEIVLLPAGGAPEETSPAPARTREGDITRRTLANGLRVLIERDRSAPDIFVLFSAPGGPAFESEATNGASRLAATLLAKGTSSMGQAEVAARVEGWGGALDSFSGQNTFGLSMSVLAPYAGKALALFAALVKNPSFDERELAKARHLQLEAIAAKKEDIFLHAADVMRKNLYRSHPYRLDPLGTPESLARIGRREVADFYRRQADPKRVVLAVFGDADPAEMAGWAEKYFGDWRPQNPPPAAPPADETLKRAVEIRERTTREQAVVTVAFNAVDARDRRRYAFEILNAVLGDSAGRLYRNIRGAKGIAYTLGSMLKTGIYPGHFALYASVEPRRTDEALALLLEEVRRIREEVPGPEEIADAKRQVLGDRERLLESKSARAFEAALSELAGPGLEEHLKFAERIDAVTSDDLRAVIAEFLDESKSLRVVVSPAPAPQAAAPKDASVSR